MSAAMKSYEQLLAEEKVRELKKALREAKKAAKALAAAAPAEPAALAPAGAAAAQPVAREVLAISAAACWDMSESLKPRSGLLSKDLKECVYEDGRRWVGFSYHDNLLACGLGGVNLADFLADCATPEEKIAKLCVERAGFSKKMTPIVAKNIVDEMALFQTPGALFVRKVSEAMGGGLDLCRVAGPYHFVPFVADGRKISYYSHRCVYEKIRDLTAEEKIALEASYTNARKMEQVVRFQIIC